MHYLDAPLRDFLDNYTRAFDKKDMDAILEHFFYPCLLITGQNAIGFNNKEELRSVIARYSRYIIGGHMTHSTSYSLRSFYHLDDNNIIISLHWTIDDKAGPRVSQFNCDYHLLKENQSYKIIVIMLPEEKF